MQTTQNRLEVAIIAYGSNIKILQQPALVDNFEMPQLTKIFVLSVVLASFLYRGIYFPIKNKIELNYLFPFNWIFVGFLGIALDIVKAPGYLLGAILATFLRSRTHKNRST